MLKFLSALLTKSMLVSSMACMNDKGGLSSMTKKYLYGSLLLSRCALVHGGDMLYNPEVISVVRSSCMWLQSIVTENATAGTICMPLHASLIKLMSTLEKVCVR